MTVEPDNDTFNSGVAPNYASITEIADAPLVRENVKSRKVVILIFIFILICFVGFSVVLGEMLAIQRHSLVDVLITPYPYDQDAEYVATPCYFPPSQNTSDTLNFPVACPTQSIYFSKKSSV